MDLVRGISAVIAQLNVDIAMVTLRDRTLNPIAERFIEHAREFTKAMRASGGRG